MNRGKIEIWKCASQIILSLIPVFWLTLLGNECMLDLPSDDFGGECTPSDITGAT